MSARGYVVMHIRIRSWHAASQSNWSRFAQCMETLFVVRIAFSTPRSSVYVIKSIADNTFRWSWKSRISFFFSKWTQSNASFFLHPFFAPTSHVSSRLFSGAVKFESNRLLFACLHRQGDWVFKKHVTTVTIVPGPLHYITCHFRCFFSTPNSFVFFLSLVWNMNTAKRVLVHFFGCLLDTTGKKRQLGL